MTTTCSLTIGTLTVAFECPSPAWRSFIAKRYAAYLAPRGLKTHARVSLRPGRFTALKNLRVSRSGNSVFIQRRDFRSLSNAGMRRTVLQVQRNRYSLDSWLRVFFTLLGLERSALLVHGAGAAFGNNSYLFPGRSGRGKSTLIRLLGRKHALSDELTLVFLRRGRVFCASTPFWGELRRGPGRAFHAPARGIYFIRHAKKAALRPVPRTTALKQLLRTVLFFDHAPASMEDLLALAAEIASAVPAFDLPFSLKTRRQEILKLISAPRADTSITKPMK
ncbi:MAG: hypothetical protein ACYC5N_04770 [Endomicrobiales bacterium]